MSKEEGFFKRAVVFFLQRLLAGCSGPILLNDCFLPISIAAEKCTRNVTPPSKSVLSIQKLKMHSYMQANYQA
jgi:hypothetical protein